MGENKDQMSFLEHLEELRWHIVRSVLSILLFAVVAFVFSNIIFDYIILAPNSPDFFTNRILGELAVFLHTPALAINKTAFEIININMAGQFTTDIQISLISGIILAFPYVFFEIWRFISPALRDSERKYSGGAIFFTSLLFFMGILFGYYIIVPLSINFLGHYNVSDVVVNQINLKSYIASVTSISLASGIIFELPMVMFFLSKVGVVTPNLLRTYRKHAIVAIVFLAAVITPPDVFSQILVSLPLIVLYEFSIVISKSVYTRKAKREAQE